MKTADLIPLILLELNESDKYGFELTKNIETKSNGHIVIKQPTLYTLLKKLEKSKFITSYWQDSEIGGKRHYYTLTSNGRMQITTLPDYEILLNNVANSEVDTSDDFMPLNHTELAHEEPTKISIMDALLDKKQEPIESVISTEELFSTATIDNATEIDLNLVNTEILKDEQTTHDENFATNEDVTTFTQKINTTPIEYSNQLSNSNETDFLGISDYKVSETNDDIKFVNYIDFKKNKAYIKSKKTAKHMLFRTLCTSFYLAIVLFICSIITNSTGKSALYNLSLITSLMIATFNPIIYIWFYKRFEEKCREKGYKYNAKQHLIISLCMFLTILLTVVIINISIGKNTFSSMFSSSNFANLFAPLLLASTLFADLLFTNIFMVKLNR